MSNFVFVGEPLSDGTTSYLNLEAISSTPTYNQHQNISGVTINNIKSTIPENANNYEGNAANILSEASLTMRKNNGQVKNISLKGLLVLLGDNYPAWGRLSKQKHIGVFPLPCRKPSYIGGSNSKSLHITSIYEHC